MALGERIKELRKEQGLTLVELAGEDYQGHAVFNRE